MNGEHNETAKDEALPVDESAATEPADAAQSARTSDDFLVPGPTADSNAGLRQWGCTWLAFSLILILLMLGISFVCWVLATWTGFA